MNGPVNWKGQTLSGGAAPICTKASRTPEQTRTHIQMNNTNRKDIK